MHDPAGSGCPTASSSANLFTAVKIKTLLAIPRPSDTVTVNADGGDLPAQNYIGDLRQKCSTLEMDYAPILRLPPRVAEFRMPSPRLICGHAALNIFRNLFR